MASIVARQLVPRLLRPDASYTPTPKRLLVSVVTIAMCSSLPVFLVGSLEVQMRDSLSMSVTRFGIALAVYFFVASVASVPGGRLSERFGGDSVLGTSAALTCIALAIIASAVTDWLELVLALVVAGFAASLAQTSANMLLAETFPKTRQGLAFGVKQAAAPLAALLAGIAVPAIALSVGWRWAFALAALIALSGAVALPRVASGPHLTRAAARGSGEGLPIYPLLALASGIFFGLVAASSLTAFVVASGVGAAALSKGNAGLVAAIGGAVGVSARLYVGWAADRKMRRPLRVIATMLGAGALGYLGLAMATSDASPLLYAAGAAAAFGLGWGWNGLFNFAVVRSYPLAPAWATSVTQAGARLGAMAGPLVFALIVDSRSYTLAWSFAGTAAALGAVSILIGQYLVTYFQARGAQLLQGEDAA